jgi:uncharacterized lipoprotein
MKFATSLLAATAMLALAACDSAAENEVEQTAEAIDESYEAEAGIDRALAQGTPEEAAVEENADRLESEGEQIKDDLENQADNMDTAPQ